MRTQSLVDALRLFETACQLGFGGLKPVMVTVGETCRAVGLPQALGLAADCLDRRDEDADLMRRLRAHKCGRDSDRAAKLNDWIRALPVAQ